jgi:tRNA (guanine-N7-)-methyltransferase
MNIVENQAELAVAPFKARIIRSFVRREGRITQGQERALAELSHTFLIEGSDLAELKTCFPRPAPLHLEIGCGAGDNLAALAALHPENNYLGIEVFRPGLGKLMQQLQAENITHVRLISADAVHVVTDHIPDQSLEGIYIFFPDPWPKKRHLKRRILQLEFARLLYRKLQTHGRVYLATDWEEYARHIIAIMAQAGFVNLAGQAHYSPRPCWRPVTRYEQRGLRLGHQVRDLVYARPA